jgi:hypothetical protein
VDPETLIYANETVAIIITIITKNQTRMYRIPTLLLQSTDGKTIFPTMAQVNQCTTITIFKAHHIITIIFMHLGEFHLLPSSRPRCQSRFMTFNPFLSKLPSSLVDI